MLNVRRVIVDVLRNERPVRYFIARLLVKTGLCSNIIIDRGTYKIRFFPANYAVQMWLNGPNFAREATFIVNWCSEVSRYIDVLAQLGAPCLRLTDRCAVKIY